MMFLVFYYVITLLSEFRLQNVELSGWPLGGLYSHPGDQLSKSYAP